MDLIGAHAEPAPVPLTIEEALVHRARRLQREGSSSSEGPAVQTDPYHVHGSSDKEMFEVVEIHSRLVGMEKFGV